MVSAQPPPPTGMPPDPPPVPFNQVPHVPAGPVPGLQYAGFWIRFLAYLIDVVPIAVIAGILNVAWGTGYRCVTSAAAGASQVTTCSTGRGGLGSWFGFAVLGVYWVLTWSLLGGSLGQKALGLRVVSAADGERIDLGRSLVRYLGFVLSCIAIFIGLIWAAFDPRKQGWHDMIANTYVVRPV